MPTTQDYAILSAASYNDVLNDKNKIDYGTHGNLTGFGVTPAQTTLANAQFANAQLNLQPWSAVSGGSTQLK